MASPFKMPTLPASALGGSTPPSQGQKRKVENGSSSDPPKRQRQSDDPLSSITKMSKPNATASKSASRPSGPQHPGPMLPPDIPVASGSGMNGREATVEDEEMEAEEERYEEEPTFEADDGDDEGGRFFGGGTSEVQDTILDILAKDDTRTSASGPQTVQDIRKLIQRFERIVQRNTEGRAKFADEPQRFMESESDLNDILHQFLPLSSSPALFYPEFIRSPTFIPILTNLLTHENEDIAIDAIGVIDDWIDEDVGEDEEDDDEKAKELRMLMGDLITAFVDNSLLELLVSNLNRFNEAEESEAAGVYKIISIFESLLSFLPPLARQVAETTELIPWLRKRIGQKEMDSNKLYASEVLSVLCQEDRNVRLAVGDAQGMNEILEVLSQYRWRDPRDMEEAEFMENCFNALCGILAEPDSKKLLEEAEGIELMVKMMKEKNMSTLRAIKALDYALQTEEGAENCVKFVEDLGLSSFFSAFMGKSMGKKSKLSALESIPESETEEHLLGILVSLFQNLASESAPRLRLLAKFIEGSYEKIDRLMELRDGAENRLAPVEKEIELERQVMLANDEEITDIETDEWYLRRLSSGLNQLQNADIVLAWLCMEYDGAMLHAKMLLERRGKSLKDVAKTLAETRDAVAEDTPEDTEVDGSQAEPSIQWIILENLTNFVSSLA